MSRPRAVPTWMAGWARVRRDPRTARGLEAGRTSSVSVKTPGACPARWRREAPRVFERQLLGRLLVLETLRYELQGPAVFRHRADRVLAGPLWEARLDLQRDEDLRPGQSCEVGDDLFGDPRRLEANARGVEAHGPVESRREL